MSQWRARQQVHQAGRRGLVTLASAPQDIRQIVAEAVEQVTPLIRARRHHLTLRLPPDSTMVMGDQKRLVQVLTNILNNAAKYTNEGGSIVLEADVRTLQVLVHVTDNGIGMSPDLAAHAFDLFAQAERSRLFHNAVLFAKLSTEPVTPQTAATQLAQAQKLMHYSPERRVAKRIIECLHALGRHNEAQAAQAHLDVVYPPKKSAQAAQDAEQEEAEED